MIGIGQILQTHKRGRAKDHQGAPGQARKERMKEHLETGFYFFCEGWSKVIKMEMGEGVGVYKIEGRRQCEMAILGVDSERKPNKEKSR